MAGSSCTVELTQCSAAAGQGYAIAAVEGHCAASSLGLLPSAQTFLFHSCDSPPASAASPVWLLLLLQRSLQYLHWHHQINDWAPFINSEWRTGASDEALMANCLRAGACNVS